MRLSIKSSGRNPPRGVLSDSTAGVPDSRYGDVLSITGAGTVRGSDRLVLANGVCTLHQIPGLETTQLSMLNRMSCHVLVLQPDCGKDN